MIAAAGLSLSANSMAGSVEKSAQNPAGQLTAITTLMDSIPGFISATVDAVQILVENNVGKPLDQLIGKTDTDLFPEDLATLFRTKDLEMLASKATRRNEEWVVYPDGHRALIDTLKTPWVDESGNLLGVLGICRDITPNPEVEKEVLAVNDQFYAALNTLFTGELAPMSEVWSHAADVTYMGPVGGFQVGWEAVQKDWEAQAAMKLGGSVEAVDVYVTAGKELAMVSNYEKGENTNANGEIQKVSIRATNLYRKEDGQWKMIGHHVDLLPQMAN